MRWNVATASNVSVEAGRRSKNNAGTINLNQEDKEGLQWNTVGGMDDKAMDDWAKCQ